MECIMIAATRRTAPCGAVRRRFAALIAPVSIYAALRGAVRRAVRMPHLFYTRSITAYTRSTAPHGAARRRAAPCGAQCECPLRFTEDAHLVMPDFAGPSAWNARTLTISKTTHSVYTFSRQLNKEPCPPPPLACLYGSP